MPALFWKEDSWMMPEVSGGGGKLLTILDGARDLGANKNSSEKLANGSKHACLPHGECAGRDRCSKGAVVSVFQLMMAPLARPVV